MIILILILSFGLRLISLNQSFWLDEATSALTTKMSTVDFFSKFMPGDFHPPFYYLLLKLWSLFFGSSEIALRSISIILGVATIYVVYLIGKNLLNKEVGIIAALLLATSGLHIYYSQEARMYILSTFLVALSIYFFTKIFHDRGRVGDWVAFSIILSLIFLSDYLPILILFSLWILAVFTKRKFSWWKKFIMSHIILMLSVLLWSGTFLKQLTSGINVTNTSPAWVNVLGKFSIKDVLLIPIKFAIGRVGFDNKIIYELVVGFIMLLFGFLIYKSREYFHKLAIIYLWLLIPISIALIISIKLPVLNYFRFLFVLPALYIILAAGIISTNRKLTLLLVAINLVTSLMYLTNTRFQREDWRSAVASIEANRVEDSLVLFPALSQMEAYRYYAPQAKISGPDALTSSYNEVWLIRYVVTISDPTDSTRIKVENIGYQKIKEYDFNGVVVWKYNKQTSYANSY